MKSFYKRGLILIYPGLQNEAKVYQYNRLIEEFKKLGIEINKLKVDAVVISIENGKSKLQLDKYDFCIQVVKDKYINEELVRNNIRSFNNFTAIENCDDKMMTYLLLAKNNINIPSTISANTNTGIENISESSLSEEFKYYVEKTLGYPLIIKKSNSKGGRDIYKIDNRVSLDNLCSKLNGEKYLFQEFISDNTGKDLRVAVVGGKVIGSFMRVNENDFRSNISLGGKAIPFAVSKEYIDTAEKVSQILKLDYCSVDFFLTDDNKPLVCEVNADPALCDIEALSGKNIAGIYAEYIVGQIYKR